MDWQEMAKQLKGLQTVSSVSKKLDVNSRTAINYIYEMRKRGYVTESRGKNKIRIYEIYPLPRRIHGYPGLYDVINANSPIKLVKPYEHRVYNEMSVEEAVVRAVKTGDFRTILASLALFNKMSNWSLLYRLAKEENLQRAVGALYDTARKSMRVRKMDNRIRNRMKQSKPGEKFIVKNMKSNDFKEIEKEWDVFVPFNKSDLGRYKETRA